MLPNLWRLQKENISSQRRIRMCLWWDGWWWWLMIQSIQTSFCLLTRRKEILTSFKLAAGWTQCCGLNIWVRPARVTSSRFLQTWWHLSRAWERGGAPLFPSRGARTCWGRPAAHPVPGRAPRLQPSLPPELRTKSTHFREWREIPREHNGVAKQTAMNYASYLRTDLWKPLP